MMWADSSTYGPNFFMASAMMILFVAFWIAVLVAGWRMFVKAGRKGWESLIPFYASYVQFDMVYGRGWRFLFLLIPVVNVVIIIKLCFDLAKVFGQSTAFGFGLLLLNPVFLMILGFHPDIEYEGTLIQRKQDEETVLSPEEQEAMRQAAMEKLRALRAAARENKEENKE